MVPNQKIKIKDSTLPPCFPVLPPVNPNDREQMTEVIPDPCIWYHTTITGSALLLQRGSAVWTSTLKIKAFDIFNSVVQLVNEECR